MMNFGSFITAAATTTTSSAAGGDSTTALIWSFLPMIAIVALLYFLMIRPQKRKEKKTQKMREALEVGDNVTTIGGVVGRVVSIKEDGIIIETGADRSKIQIKKWAIQSVDTVHDVG
jgi:preprotein translocase subunit YajC